MSVQRTFTVLIRVKAITTKFIFLVSGSKSWHKNCLHLHECKFLVNVRRGRAITYLGRRKTSHDRIRTISLNWHRHAITDPWGKIAIKMCHEIYAVVKQRKKVKLPFLWLSFQSAIFNHGNVLSSNDQFRPKYHSWQNGEDEWQFDWEQIVFSALKSHMRFSSLFYK